MNSPENQLPALIPRRSLIAHVYPDGMGCPTIIIDWPAFEEMCKIQCTIEEISSILGISVDTLERRVKEEYKVTFAEYIQSKRSEGKASLRREQYIKAVRNKDTTMQIWLGKQWLGQTDKQVNLNLTADLGTIPEGKREQLGQLLDALYKDEE
jgi:AraC-like DNA-binding protein